MSEELNEGCQFVPAHEPWMCSVHRGGYRNSLDETVCRAAQAENVQPLTPAEVEEFDRWAESRKGRGVSLGFLWALRLRATLDAERAASQGDEGLREASANCAAGDHDDCAGMVEQDAPGVGITPCRCPCHTLRENPDGTLQYPAGHFTTLAASLAASVNDELRAVMLVVSSLAHDLAREYAALAAEEERA